MEEGAGSSKREEGSWSTRKAEEQDEGRRIERQNCKSFKKLISYDEIIWETEAAAGGGKNPKCHQSKWVFTEEGWSNIRRQEEDDVKKRNQEKGKEERGGTEEDDPEEEGETETIEGDKSHEMMEDESEEVYREEDEDGSFDESLIIAYKGNDYEGNIFKCKECGKTYLNSGSMKSHKCKVQKKIFLNCDLCLTRNKHSVKVPKTGGNSYICGVCNTVTIVYLI